MIFLSEGADCSELFGGNQELARIGAAVFPRAFLPDLDMAVDLFVDVGVLDAGEHVAAEARENVYRRISERHRSDRGD